MIDEWVYYCHVGGWTAYRTTPSGKPCVWAAGKPERYFDTMRLMKEWLNQYASRKF